MNCYNLMLILKSFIPQHVVCCIVTQQLLHHDPAIVCTCKANNMPYRIFFLFSIRFHRTHVKYTIRFI